MLLIQLISTYQRLKNNLAFLRFSFSVRVLSYGTYSSDPSQSEEWAVVVAQLVELLLQSSEICSSNSTIGKLFFLNGPFSATFSFVFFYSGLQLTDKLHSKTNLCLPMLGFKPRISGVRSDRSANCATNTAHRYNNLLLAGFCLKIRQVNQKVAGNGKPFLQVKMWRVNLLFILKIAFVGSVPDSKLN